MLPTVSRPAAAALMAWLSTAAFFWVQLRDPRATAEDNEAFLSMMERYYAQPDADKLPDVRPELSYQVRGGYSVPTCSLQNDPCSKQVPAPLRMRAQVGATPAGVEVPRCLMDPECAEQIARLPQDHKATLPTGPGVQRGCQHSR